MISKEVVRSKDRLDALFSKVAAIGDVEMKSHWSRYLCVLVSGFIEVAFVQVVSEYAKRRSSPDVARFVVGSISQFQNAKIEKMLTVIGSFNTEWRDEIDAATKGELADAVNSVVANRHLIAHGNSVGISFTTIKDYYDRVIKVIELIEVRFS
jgi:hypothetical protein